MVASVEASAVEKGPSDASVSTAARSGDEEDAFRTGRRISGVPGTGGGGKDLADGAGAVARDTKSTEMN